MNSAETRAELIDPAFKSEGLPALLELKYHGIGDAINELGETAAIRELFVGFQAHLYGKEGIA